VLAKVIVDAGRVHEREAEVRPCVGRQVRQKRKAPWSAADPDTANGQKCNQSARFAYVLRTAINQRLLLSALIAPRTINAAVANTGQAPLFQGRSPCDIEWSCGPR
jgi:hypothetical protein